MNEKKKAIIVLIIAIILCLIIGIIGGKLLYDKVNDDKTNNKTSLLS